MLMKSGRRYLKEEEYLDDPKAEPRTNRWCERHGYFIDLAACEARAETKAHCIRCIARWRQLSFPFMES